MKVLNLSLMVLFLIFAAVQINDVDPWQWVTWYVFLAVLTGLAAFKRLVALPVWVGLAICVVALVRLFPTFQQWVSDGMPSIIESMKAETPYVEFVREFLGLLIGLIVLVSLLFQVKK